MPNSPYDKKSLVYVPVGLAGNMIFRTAADSTLYSDLGYTAVSAAAIPAKPFFEANSPRPAIARRITSAGVDNYFCDPSNAATLGSNGWQVSPAKFKGIAPSAGSRVTSVYVTTNTTKYAWNEPNFKATTTTSGVKTDLGIEIATASDILSLVWGSSIKPAVAVTTVVATGTQGPVNTVRSFVSDAKINSLPAGWLLVKNKTDLTTMFL